MVLIAVAIGVTSLAAAVGSAMKHRKLWAGVFGVITFLAYAWLHHFRPVIGLPWFLFGLGIFLFEFVVAVLQAYIFTLLSAVYIQTSVHPEH
jgi:F0F1-type ATP synthase membrane subunit a